MQHVFYNLSIQAAQKEQCGRAAYKRKESLQQKEKDFLLKMNQQVEFIYSVQLGFYSFFFSHRSFWNVIKITDKEHVFIHPHVGGFYKHVEIASCVTLSPQMVSVTFQKSSMRKLLISFADMWKRKSPVTLWFSSLLTHIAGVWILQHNEKKQCQKKKVLGSTANFKHFLI